MVYCRCRDHARGPSYKVSQSLRESGIVQGVSLHPRVLDGGHYVEVFLSFQISFFGNLPTRHTAVVTMVVYVSNFFMEARQVIEVSVLFF